MKTEFISILLSFIFYFNSQKYKWQISQANLFFFALVSWSIASQRDQVPLCSLCWRGNKCVQTDTVALSTCRHSVGKMTACQAEVSAQPAALCTWSPTAPYDRLKKKAELPATQLINIPPHLRARLGVCFEKRTVRCDKGWGGGRNMWENF